MRGTILQVLVTQKERLELTSEDIKEIEKILAHWELEFIPKAREQMTKSMTDFIETLNLEDYQDILIEAQRSQTSSK